MAAAQLKDVLCTIEVNRPPAGLAKPGRRLGRGTCFPPTEKCDHFATVLLPLFETQILSSSAPIAYVVHLIKRSHFTGPAERNRTIPNAFRRPETGNSKLETVLRKKPDISGRKGGGVSGNPPKTHPKN